MTKRKIYSYQIAFILAVALFILFVVVSSSNGQSLNIDSLKRSAVNEFLADVNNKVLEARKAIPIGEGEQILKSNNFIELVNSMKEYCKTFKFK